MVIMIRNYVSPYEKEEMLARLICNELVIRETLLYTYIINAFGYELCSSVADEIKKYLPELYNELKEKVSIQYQEWLYDAEGHHPDDEE